MSTLRTFLQDSVQLASPERMTIGASKGPQSSRGLNFSRAAADKRSTTASLPVANKRRRHPGHRKNLNDRDHRMPTPTPAPTSLRNERQLVFTSSQAARYVGVSLATVRRWTDAGHIDCYRTPGGQRRFSRAQLDEFIVSMQRTGGASADTRAERRDAQVA